MSEVKPTPTLGRILHFLLGYNPDGSEALRSCSVADVGKKGELALKVTVAGAQDMKLVDKAGKSIGVTLLEATSCAKLIANAQEGDTVGTWRWPPIPPQARIPPVVEAPAETPATAAPVPQAATSTPASGEETAAPPVVDASK